MHVLSLYVISVGRAGGRSVTPGYRAPNLSMNMVCLLMVSPIIRGGGMETKK